MSEWKGLDYYLEKCVEKFSLPFIFLICGEKEYKKVLKELKRE